MNENLEERTIRFAVSIRTFLKLLPKSISNLEDGKQLIRSSGSVGANYIEANEKLSRRDLIYRLRIALKEAKESSYWLHIISKSNRLDEKLENRLIELIEECQELRNILFSILRKLQKS